MFALLKPSPFKDKVPRWAVKVPHYPLVFGFSAFADLFICSEDQKHVAVLATEKPELIQLKFESITAFEEEFLSNTDVRKSFFREADYLALTSRLGALSSEECFYAVPYRSLGGSGNLNTYEKGNAWVHLDLYGQTVGL